jgi:hypothetical protein
MQACKLGSKQHSTPLSVGGPGCSGSVLSNARVSRCLIDRMLAYRTGRQHAYLMGPTKAPLRAEIAVVAAGMQPPPRNRCQ